MTDIESLSREFCKLVGICWHTAVEDEKGTETHCWKCRVKNPTNPDFFDAREVLKYAPEEFITWFTIHYTKPQIISYLRNITGLLLKEAVEFMRREKP